MPLTHPIDPVARSTAKKIDNQTAVFLAVIALLAAFPGYQIGKDLAEKDNRADCVAADLAPDCASAPRR